MSLPLHPRPIGAALLLIAGCGARTGTEDIEETEREGLAFPVGTFTGCARGIVTTDPGHFFHSSGFETDATLTLERTGGAVIATYRDVAGDDHTLDFAIVGNHSAALAPSGQAFTGHTGFCVRGIGWSHTSPFPADLIASSAAITYDFGTVLVALEGRLEGDGAECGRVSATAALWIACDEGPTPESGERTAPSPVPRFPTGALDCTSQIMTEHHEGGTTYVTGNGGSGSLEIAQAGAELTASYGDDALSQSARLTAITGVTAIAAPGASVRTFCDVPLPSTGPMQEPTLGAATMTAGESSVVLSFAGAMDASTTCPGARKAGAIVCLSP
jgi:hypothetical protein